MSELDIEVKMPEQRVSIDAEIPWTIINKARDFCVAAHSGQRRKYTEEGYSNHCERVAQAVMKMTFDPEVIAAAYLHDVLEDCREITSEIIQEKFGPRVLSIVRELTNVYTKEAYPALNREERKSREAARLGTVSLEAKMIKRCDIADNLPDFVMYDPEFAIVYMKEKARVLEEMAK